jgi:hypothetical protein
MTTLTHLTYSEEHGGLVCTCAAVECADGDGYSHVEYVPTVRCVREVEPTESGSWFYRCSRCGACAWSGT